MRLRFRASAVAALVAAGSLTTLVAGQSANADTLICEQFGSTTIQSRYVVQNNRWGTSATQCINVTATGFQVTQADGATATNGAPKSYPSVYAGCHYTNCSPGTNLPIQISTIGTATSSVSYTYVNNATYDAAYDIWLDPTPKRDGVNQTEIMIWFNRVGPIQPVGSPVATGTVDGRTWQIWTGSNGSNNVISFVAPAAIPSASINLLEFINAAIGRGLATRAWYLTSIQAGFEPWQGGAGLAVNSFSATVTTGGSGGDTQAPSTPTGLTASGVTASSANLGWSASTDNVGVTGYTVLRRQGSAGAFTPVGTSTGPSFQATGLTAATQYEFQVTARDAAGNTSSPSSPVSVTTSPGGGGPAGGCTVSYTPNVWSTGFTTDIRVVNGGSTAVNGWSLAFTLPAGQSVTSAWNTALTATSGAITARNVDFNAVIPANGGTQSFGFQGTYTGTFTRPAAFTLNGTACTTG